MTIPPLVVPSVSTLDGTVEVDPPQVPIPDLRTWRGTFGKPYVTVSAKGLKNGLSTIFNDGADFGVDTPNTNTYGILEAYNYAYDNSSSQIVPTIRLLDGVFSINGDIPINDTIHLIGTGAQSTLLIFYSGSGFTINGDNVTNDTNIEDIGLFNNTASTATAAFTFTGSKMNAEIHFTRCFMGVSSNPFTNGVVYGSFSTQTGSNWYFIGCNFNNYQSSMGVNLNNVHNVFFIGTELYCITQITNSRGLFFTGCQTYNINVGLNESVVLYNCQMFERIEAIDNTTNITIDGCVLDYSKLSLAQIISIASGKTLSSLTLVNSQYILINNALLLYPGNTIGATHYKNNINNTPSYTLTLYYPTIALTANPPVSDTPYKNPYEYDIIIYLPAYATSSGTAGTIEILVGNTSTPDQLLVYQYVGGGTSSTSAVSIHIHVPAGWYYEVILTGVSLGTATVMPD